MYCKICIIYIKSVYQNIDGRYKIFHQLLPYCCHRDYFTIIHIFIQVTSIIHVLSSMDGSY